MHERLQGYGERLTGGTPEDDNPPVSEFKALRVLAAQLLVLTSVDVTLDSLSRARAAHGPFPHGSPGPDRTLYSVANRWAPVLIAPLAAAAQLTRALRPSPATGRAAQALNVAAIGVGLAGVVGSLVAARRDRHPPSLSPLALASTGLLGLVLEREESSAELARHRMSRRVARARGLADPRGRRPERIVIHL